MTQHKFKPGDKVRIKENADAAGRSMEAELGQIREVKGLDGTTYEVWNEDKTDYWYWFPEELELVEKAPESIDETVHRAVSDKLNKPRTIQYTDQGFNPEKLTFDGEEIKAGDYIYLYGDNTRYLVTGEGKELYFDRKWLIKKLNITAHYPKIKTITYNGKQYERTTELERLNEEVRKIIYEIQDFDGDYSESVKLLDRYYQARKALEEYISKLKEM